jgi:hypothetical protein
MVSRFAMNLPDFTQPQPWIEPSCDWDMLEEVSPLFSEERRLLHAGKALCVAGGRRAGSVVVHSMLDYGNLSFISAQNPYVALVRRNRGRKPGRAPTSSSSSTAGAAACCTAPTRPRRRCRRCVPARLRIAHAVLGDDDPRIEFARCLRPQRSRGDLRARDRAAERLWPPGREAELLALAFIVFAAGVLANMIFQPAGRPRAGVGPRAVRGSAGQLLSKTVPGVRRAAIIPVLALALVSRTYMANLMLADVESEADAPGHG